MSGKIIVDIGRKYIIHPTSYTYKYIAEVLYEKTVDDCLADQVVSKEDKAFELMLFRNKLPYNYKETLKEKRESIDNKKVNLFEVLKEKNIEEANRIKKEIEGLSNEVSFVLERLHCLDNISAEGIAEMEKQKYLVKKSIKKKISAKTLDKIIEWLSRNYIREAEYRKIVKSGLFFNLINAKPSLFKNYPLTDEQLSLMYWHKFYRNVYKSDDKPFDWIIDDDMALDGWYIFQSRKRAKMDSVSYVESKIHSTGTRDSQELFVFAPPEMSDVVNESNDATGKVYKKAFRNMIDKGKLDESTENNLSKGFGIRG